MTPKEKAIEYFMKREVELCTEINDQPEYPLQLDDTLDLAIKEAKQEVIEKLQKWVKECQT